MRGCFITPIPERFEDPFYPVSVTIEDQVGEIIFEHDRMFGRFLVSDDNVRFKSIIDNIQRNSKTDWAKLTSEIKDAVFEEIRKSK
ncbi:hypothetical protein [Paenibacillus nasutitermitis]|uniref:Uncharacterized protein n=1 Tax=Paenibacillus nasutitermitis TaxID=1652958 RepID=A0A916ZJB2_9BACL|nr:hypothetical protein [Paenibacillus nasutitermitis]GGE00048.1 hypothetical protein GCM10010911_68750 [Paenibacillus nasutitermitis]